MRRMMPKILDASLAGDSIYMLENILKDKKLLELIEGIKKRRRKGETAKYTYDINLREGRVFNSFSESLVNSKEWKECQRYLLKKIGEYSDEISRVDNLSYTVEISHEDRAARQDATRKYLACFHLSKMLDRIEKARGDDPSALPSFFEVRDVEESDHFQLNNILKLIEKPDEAMVEIEQYKTKDAKFMLHHKETEKFVERELCVILDKTIRELNEPKFQKTLSDNEKKQVQGIINDIGEIMRPIEAFDYKLNIRLLTQLPKQVEAVNTKLLNVSVVHSQNLYERFLRWCNSWKKKKPPTAFQAAMNNALHNVNLKAKELNISLGKRDEALIDREIHGHDKKPKPKL